MLNYKSFTKPYRCSIQGLKAIGLRSAFSTSITKVTPFSSYTLVPCFSASSMVGLHQIKTLECKCGTACKVKTRNVEAAISSTASASNASASNKTWTLTEPGLYLICELADKHDYQNQQLTIYKGTFTT